MTNQRDIDLLLITGAGASCAFGLDGQPLPLMGEWSDALVRKLAGSGYRDLVGLQPGLSGRDFEVQLGRFLQRAKAFPDMEALLAPAAAIPRAAPVGITGDGLVAWHRSICHHLLQAESVIHASLYEEFGSDKVDIATATKAYQTLFTLLQISDTSRVVIATTNYDRIAERVLERLGRLPDCGEVVSTRGGSEKQVKPRRVLDGMPRYTPVLHLHGCIGWYRRPESTETIVTDAPHYSDGMGAPIVMLPDPQKAYDDELLVTIWQEFELALPRADRILVLGHSLNDSALIAAIQRNVDRLERVGVTVLRDAENTENLDASTRELQGTIDRELPNAVVVPAHFDAQPAFELVKWEKARRALVG